MIVTHKTQVVRLPVMILKIAIAVVVVELVLIQAAKTRLMTTQVHRKEITVLIPKVQTITHHRIKLHKIHRTRMPAQIQALYRVAPMMIRIVIPTILILVIR